MAYPEHEKLAARGVAAQEVGEFLEWLTSTEYVLSVYAPDGEWLMPSTVGINELLAEYLGINRAKLEAEKKHMLMAAQKARRSSRPPAVVDASEGPGIAAPWPGPGSTDHFK